MRCSSSRRSLLPMLLAGLLLLQVQATLLEDSLRLALRQARCPDDLKASQKCDSTSNDVTNIPYLETASESNINLACKDVNRLVFKHDAGIYVIETADGSLQHDNWTSPTLSQDGLYESRNLLPKHRYRYRIRQVTLQGVALPEISEWYQTNDETYVPRQVKNVLVGKIIPNKNRPGHLQARLDIIPADDLNCQYNVIHWGGEHDLYQYQLDAAREYSLELRHLNYERNNTVVVVSRNELGSRSSKNATLTFQTPSCLSAHHDLNVCAPAPVTGLHVVFQSNKNSVDFQVVWEEPELQPNNYTIIVEPLDFENSSVQVTVSGNETTADIPQVVLSHQYKIAILAESEGGTSLEWMLITVDNRITVESQVIIAISTLTTLVLVVVFGYTYIRYKRMKGHDCRYSFFENINRQASGFQDIKGPLKTLSPYETEDSKMRDKFEIQVDRLSIKKILGSGISGVVKLATLQVDKKKIIHVAVKMLREDASSEDVQNLHKEIALMKSVGNHPNIVSIIGCCTRIQQPLLVVEFCSRGDLQTYLRAILEEMMSPVFKQVDWAAESNVSSILQRESNDLAWAINNRLYDIQQESEAENGIDPQDLINFARQVASGMEFLSSNRIVHRDLAARNVLVCADQTVKISDFGLSRDIYQENVYKKQTNGKLPIKWMAIEALTHQVYTTHSDVWSFGVLLYEIVTLGGNPYPGLPSSEILHFLKSGYRMERPSNCGFQLYEIMRSCWHENPLNRPTFYNLKQQLDKLLNTFTGNEYLNLSELAREPTTQHRYFLKRDRKNSNILTIPHII